MSSLDSERGRKVKGLAIRFIKFNLVGTVVFLVATVIYAVFFGMFGFWTWLVANGVGAILQFTLISVLNRTRRGKIFDAAQSS